MTKRNPEFDGFSAYFAVRAETDRKGKSTPPARTETPTYQQQMSHHNISTHSAHEDGDGYVAGGPERSCHFNPLRPRGRRLLPDLKHIPNVQDFNPLRPRGRRRLYAAYHYPGRGFQPTPPTRTETICISPWLTGSGIFQPTPPTRTETSSTEYCLFSLDISTHSAHEDGD